MYAAYDGVECMSRVDGDVTGELKVMQGCRLTGGIDGMVRVGSGDGHGKAEVLTDWWRWRRGLGSCESEWTWEGGNKDTLGWRSKSEIISWRAGVSSNSRRREQTRLAGGHSQAMGENMQQGRVGSAVMQGGQPRVGWRGENA